MLKPDTLIFELDDLQVYYSVANPLHYYWRDGAKLNGQGPFLSINACVQDYKVVSYNRALPAVVQFNQNNAKNVIKVDFTTKKRILTKV